MLWEGCVASRCQQLAQAGRTASRAWQLFGGHAGVAFRRRAAPAARAATCAGILRCIPRCPTCSPAPTTCSSSCGTGTRAGSAPRSSRAIRTTSCRHARLRRPRAGADGGLIPTAASAADTTDSPPPPHSPCPLLYPQLVFNPKDTNTFASASLDRTIKVQQGWRCCCCAGHAAQAARRPSNRTPCGGAIRAIPLPPLPTTAHHPRRRSGAWATPRLTRRWRGTRRASTAWTTTAVRCAALRMLGALGVACWGQAGRSAAASLQTGAVDGCAASSAALLQPRSVSARRRRRLPTPRRRALPRRRRPAVPGVWRRRPPDQSVGLPDQGMHPGGLGGTQEGSLEATSRWQLAPAAPEDGSAPPPLAPPAAPTRVRGRGPSQPQTLDGHSHNIATVSFHPELPLIITGSEDGTVKLWHSTT